jgi:hypothetical protein
VDERLLAERAGVVFLRRYAASRLTCHGWAFGPLRDAPLRRLTCHG